LISTNHWLLASLGVSVGALDAIHNVARIHGQACKLTGAGGGGLAFIWLEPSCTNEQLDALQKELTANKFRFWPARLGVKGVRVEDC
jgi:mevalonate kinase